MSPVKRKSREIGSHVVRESETRQQIIVAAQTLFLERGYNGVSMKDVAEAVQITSAALYYHFPGGKQELFFSMVDALIENWTGGARRVIETSQAIRERLTAFADYLFTLPLDRLLLLARDIIEQSMDHEARRRMMQETRHSLLQMITDIFQQAIDTGEIKGDIPAFVLANLFEGMVASMLRSKHLPLGKMKNLDARQFSLYVTSVMLDGITLPEYPNKEPQ